MRKRTRKLASIFLIAWGLNTIENLILLAFFSVPIARNSIVGAILFGIAFTWVYHLLKM